MMVNLVLGYDWNQVFGDPNYIAPGRPLSIPEINLIVKEFGFSGDGFEGLDAVFDG